MSTWNIKPEGNMVRKKARGLASVMLGVVVMLAFVGLSRQAYCQQSDTLMDEFIKGGPSGAWIPHPENPWLQGLRITGLLQNTSGIWINPHGIRTNTAPFYNGKTATNSLATERNLMQIDTNYDLDGSNHFFLRFWGIYEPQYAFDQTRPSVDAGALNHTGNQVGCNPPALSGVVGGTHCTASSAADMYNQLGFREAWWRMSLGPVRLFTGRQTVTWGESLAFRIADVVNPQDVSWNFGFANLEQSRIPQWMLHPIVELPEMSMLTQNFVEGIWEPPIQDAYNNWLWTNEPDQHYAGAYGNADSVNFFDASGGRFDINQQTPFGGPFPFPGHGSPAGYSAYPQASGVSNLLPAHGPNQILKWDIPGTQLSDSQEGIRFHTLIDQLVEGTLLYWHGHQYSPGSKLENVALAPFGKVGPDGKPIDDAVNFYPQLNDIGFTGNMPINLPGQLGAMFPFVLRSEGVWQDKTPFATRSPAAPSGFKYSSTFNTLVALDADQIYAPWLTSTGGSLTVNLEWNNYTIVSPSRWLEYGPLTFQQARHNEESFIFAASTSWWWQSIAPQYVMVYNPDGNTILMFPNIALVPPWTSQYFMKLQYIGVISNNIQDDYAGGLLKGKNFVLAQFQWNFNVL